MKRALIAIALVACHDLPDLGTCGNGILEAEQGEACDGDDAGDTCSDTCQLLCQSSAVDDRYVNVAPLGSPEIYCPDARMRCGVDGVCRAPSGQFASLGPAQPFDIREAQAGDFDGDGIDDLIGSSATQIVVRLGATSNTFEGGFAQASPSTDSPIAIFDRFPGAPPADGASDLAIGVPTDGLAILSSDTETFGPDLDLTFEADDSGQQLVVIRDPDPALAGSDVVIAVPRQGQLNPKRIAIAGAHTERALPSCSGPGSTLITVAVSRDRRSFVIVGRAPGTFFACLYLPSGNSFLVSTLGSGDPPPDAAVLAQVDNDACPDLVLFRRNPPGAPGTVTVVAAGVNCGLTTVTSIAMPTDNDELLDAGSIVPRAAGVERDELVFASGVYQLEGGVLTRVIGPTSEINPWTSAAVVDISGDGQLDVVAARAGQDDVDIVRGGAAPNVYRADTAAPVVGTTAGDFDGDGVGDVALIEQGGQGQRISILYGVRDGTVGDPVVNSRFGGTLRVAALRRFTWLDTTRGTDNLDDLVVLQSTAPQMTRGGVMTGDAARLMTVPRIPPFASLAAPQPIGSIAVANFDGERILALALRPENRVAPTGRSRLAFNDLDPMNATMWTDNIIVEGFEIDTLRPLVVVRTAGLPRVGAYARQAMPAPGEMPTEVPFGLVDLAGNACTGVVPGSAVNLRAVDIDGDGLDELAVGSLSNGLGIHVFPITTAGASCTIGAELLVDALSGCSDLARVGNQLVALCPSNLVIGPGRSSGIFRIDADGNREQNPAVTIDGNALGFVVGDFDGDGVPDLAVRIGRAAEVSVQLVKQCPAHDVRGCQ